MAWFDIITDGWQYVHLINLDARGASVRCASLGIICAALVLLQPHTYRLDDVLCGSSFPLTSFLCALRHRLPIHATAQHTTVPLSHGLQPVSSQKQKCFFQISNTLRRAPPRPHVLYCLLSIYLRGAPWGSLGPDDRLLRANTRGTVMVRAKRPPSLCRCGFLPQVGDGPFVLGNTLKRVANGTGFPRCAGRYH
jgi:hypothetical protein